MTSRIHFGAILAIASGMLGACATYPQAPQRIAYYVVPCDTPGAILTGAPASLPSIATAPGEAAPSDIAAGASAGAAPPSAPVCIVAATRPPAYASSRYYPSGYYGRSYYARPVFSAFGFGHYGGGSSGGGGHRGGGHGAGGHHGGGRH
ncbi:hypothetical protein [Phenylobacterium sp. SCN 70-31]|uniref:hypothetical protein n=1 Tax=Phenylobacterium sp. SCN 70-31 TaxID=1660129 RepID=UPI0025FA8C24|nr:hypothetical protein [Phenylobacterium sp. SCN 70-31]